MLLRRFPGQKQACRKSFPRVSTERLLQNCDPDLPASISSWQHNFGSFIHMMLVYGLQRCRVRGSWRLVPRFQKVNKAALCDKVEFPVKRP